MGPGSQKLFWIYGAILFVGGAPTFGTEFESKPNYSVSPGMGDPAPVFQAQDDSGRVWTSKEKVGGKILVVYFFPAALTGG